MNSKFFKIFVPLLIFDMLLLAKGNAVSSASMSCYDAVSAMWMERLATCRATITTLQNRLEKAENEHLLLTSNPSEVLRCPVFPHRRNEIYKIKFNGLSYFEVPCRTGGWMLIQKRFDGSENFDLSWSDYRNGFGNINGEFFIGLEKLHFLTLNYPNELLINLRFINGSSAYAHYNVFSIRSEDESYALNVRGYSGTAGDSLGQYENNKFQIYGNNYDKYDSTTYSHETGGWWSKSINQSNLNGKYFKEGHSRDEEVNGITWRTCQDNDYNSSLTSVEIMLRRVDLKFGDISKNALQETK